MELYFPTSIRVSSADWSIVDNAARFESALTGQQHVAARPGDKWTALLRLDNQDNSSAAALAALQGFVAAMRGGINSVWLKDHSYELRGSFPASEMLTNHIFADGTTGWTTQNSTLSVHDRVMRVTVSKASGAGPALKQSTNPTVTQYVPYILRGFLGARSRSGLNAGTYTNGTSNYSTDAQGLISQVIVPITTSLGATYPVVYDGAGTVTLTGDWIDCPYSSLSRCALVDNGPNYLLQSDDFTTTWTNTRSSDAANSTTAPNGTSTADSIIEDATASSTHYIQQNVTVPSTTNVDYAFTVALKAGTRSFARVELLEGTGNHECYIDVNLSNGATGTATASGANWANPRAFVRSLNNGWYAVTVVGRKVSSTTTVGALVILATSLGGTNYSGDGASLIYAWRGTLAQSSVPTRLVQTTTTAVSSGTAQTGTAMYVKGLPASTNGLLLPGDRVQIGNELKMITAALNSDAAGLGYLQFAPALRSSPADNAPIIINQPMAKMMFPNQEAGWTVRPGVFGSSLIELVEDLR